MQPIELDSSAASVPLAAGTAIYWRGKQWAVTDYGIECLQVVYPIPAVNLDKDVGDITGNTWPAQLAAKSWVDTEEFATAWLVGLMFHSKAKTVTAEQIFEVFEIMRQHQHQGARMILPSVTSYTSG